jgi:heme exporter protein A
MQSVEVPASGTKLAHELVASNLRLDRGTRSIIRALTFSVGSGQALILRGTNGSGKTSLLRILAGLTIPDAGTVAWDGQRMKSLSAAWRHAVIYLGHTNALKDDFTAQENLHDALTIDGMNVAPAAQLAALDTVGLLDRRHVLARRLSQGQKRRIGLARLTLALSHHPRKPLWLLDEPTNALDDKGVALFTGVISEHLKGGGIACIATHLAFNLPSSLKELDLDSQSASTQ